MTTTSKRRCLSICFFVGLAIGTNGSVAQKTTGSAYLKTRKSHTTVLTTQGPAPQQAQELEPPDGVSQISYMSGDLKLMAWFALPATAKESKTAKIPAVVFFHGGFAFGDSDFRACKPFLDAGFAVMTPTLRGENGNPGSFQLFYGEIDDARAAVKWLAKQPRIDVTRIYTFGHSVGGGVSAMLSLWDDVPIRLGGSAGGLYSKDVFTSWRQIAPFDVDNEKEKQLRVLVGNIASMKHPHIAYLGSDDSLSEIAPEALEEAKRSGAPLTVKIIAGDHYISLGIAIDEFLKVIKADKAT